MKGFGIKQVIEEILKGVEYDKVKIAEKLYDNLFDEYENSKNNEIFERPIFQGAASDFTFGDQELFSCGYQNVVNWRIRSIIEKFWQVREICELGWWCGCGIL